MDILVHPKEKIYFVLSAIVAVIFYASMIISIAGALFLIGLWIVGYISFGIFMGSIRGNAIKISENQYPDVYRIAKQLAVQMGMKYLPAIYVLQEGGALNAFATRFTRRNFVVIFADVFELAYEKGEGALAFILCHELTHIKKNHVRYQWLIDGAAIIPFLAMALSRVREYTCDRHAAYYRPDGIVDGLTVLAAGKKLYKTINAQEYMNQTQTDTSFWIWFAEKLSTHPNLPNRLREAQKIGRTAPGVSAPFAPQSPSVAEPLPSHIV
ncbi:M48 family metallopeptidase [Candidatus Uhrbacteria bacterium]|nr:M48 family metallopeptidase [Candidatus Uhrbacteria bacterium]